MPEPLEDVCPCAGPCQAGREQSSGETLGEYLGQEAEGGFSLSLRCHQRGRTLEVGHHNFPFWRGEGGLLSSTPRVVSGPDLALSKPGLIFTCPNTWRRCVCGVSSPLEAMGTPG